MKYIDRTLVILLSLAAAVASAGLVGLAVGIVDGERAISYLTVEPIALGFVGIVVFAVSLRVLQMSLRKKKTEEQTVITSGELGNIKITLGAIKKLVKTIIETDKEVKDIESDVSVKEDGVSIFLKLGVASPGSISKLAQELQKEVKEQVAETTGAKVKTVEVLIEEVEREAKASEVKVD